MEFYSVCGTFLAPFSTCFNSQRDGILPTASKSTAALKSFQFPTGWNSTQKSDYILVNVKFQFPTGWNSTITHIIAVNIFVFQFPTGWNSTSISNYIDSFAYVSIPNGMEFYASQNVALSDKFCFNSQRDGILHSLLVLFISPKAVSIPNGMEFYVLRRKQ